MTESGPETCAACGGPLRRVLYPAGIIFKGSGFYSTDSRSSGNGHRSSSVSGSTGESATKGAGEKGEKKESGSPAPAKPAADASSGEKPS